MKFKKLGLVILITCSFSALAKVSIEEKENRVKFIERIGSVAPAVSVDAYKRELEYERQGLPHSVRARREARLLAEQVQSQIAFAYELALKEHGDAEKARQEVREAILKDLELAAPEFKEELLALSMETLDNAENGGLSNTGKLANLEKSILPNVKARAKYLNEDVMDATYPFGGHIPPVAQKDSERTEYKSHQELVEALVSDRENTRWVTTSNKIINSGNIVTTEQNISYQVKIEFLGVALEAGPTINFRREYVTSVTAMAEELTPIVLPNGNFDFHKRDAGGKIIYKDGVAQKRFVVFFCSAELRFTTDYKGAGGFKYAGMGASANVMDSYVNGVTYNTRRILVPEYVGGKTVTLEYLAQICQKDFLKAKIANNMTVEKSLNIEMKNVIAGLRFSHPQTKCAVDTHCIDWFNNEVISIWRYGTYPRCVEESREKYRSCALKGLEGQACRIYDKGGKLISAGSWEVDCDKNLKCVQTQAPGWLSKAKGKCMPINPATYRDPKKYPEYRTVNDYIDVEIVD